MFVDSDATGTTREVAEEVRVTKTHTVRYGELKTEIELETDLDDESSAIYVEPSVYYMLTDDLGIDPETVRVHKFEAA